MRGIVKISFKWQLVIPRNVRIRLRLKAGDYFLIKLGGNEVKLRKIEHIERFRGILKKGVDDLDLEEKFEEAMAISEV